MTIKAAKRAALQYLEQGNDRLAVVVLRMTAEKMSAEQRTHADVNVWRYLSGSRSRADDFENLGQWIRDMPES